MASLSLKHVYKIYQGNVKAVSDFNLDIDDKEFVVFVGPSGCGKSTTLRMVAGLEEISAGDLYIDQTRVNDVEPKDRDIAMVFQNYALYPHMTVYDNMAFGLRLKRSMKSAEIDRRVKEAANILGITQYLTRKPKELSGGQRQRVALGRAIVRNPKVFLLDEPLSNLDAKLRVQMRTEITKLHNKLGTTFIYVTHDQTEAMTMGTRLVVMKDGLIQQVDTPQNLYDNPINLFVASFIGTPQMNFFKSTLSVENGKMFCTFGNNKIAIPQAKAKRLVSDSYIGAPVVLGVRPEDIHDEEMFISSNPDTVITAVVDVIEKLGNETILYLNVDGKEDFTVARIDARSKVAVGDVIKLAIDARHIHFFDAATELSIMGVPAVNKLEAKLLAEDDKLVIRFGSNAITLPNTVSSRLMDEKYINGDVIFGIAPDALKVYSDDEFDAKLEAQVDFTEKYPRYTALYSKVSGKKGFMIAKADVNSELSGGDKINYYFDPSAIMLYDVETGDEIMSSKPISNNSAQGTLAVKNNVATLSFGKNSLSFMTRTGFNSDGATTFSIEPTGFEIGKEAISKAGKMVIGGVVQHVDEKGSKSVIYAKVDGFDQYVTAIVDGAANYMFGDKIKLAVKNDALVNGTLLSIAEKIAEKAAEAPAYIQVEPDIEPIKEEAKDEEIAKEEVKDEVKEEIKAEVEQAAEKEEEAKDAADDESAATVDENEAEKTETAAKAPKATATKSAAKPASKTASKSTAAKPASKTASKSTAAKPASKTASKSTAAKPAAKTASKSTAAKPASKTASKSTTAKKPTTKK